MTTTTNVLRLTTPIPPSSNNAYLNAAKGRRLTPRGRAFKKEVGMLALQAGVQKLNIQPPYSLEVWLYFPDLHRRDVDGFHKLLLLFSCKSRIIRAHKRVVRRCGKHPGPGQQIGAVDVPDSSNAARRIPDDAIVEAYKQTGNIWKAAEIVGCSGQTVQRRLKKLGIERSRRHVTEQEIEEIRRHYEMHASSFRGALNVEQLSARLNRSAITIERVARKLGLTNSNRLLAEPDKLRHAAQIKASRDANGHPRGMLGKQHTEEACMRRGQAARDWWANATEEQLEQRFQRHMESRRINGAEPANVQGGGGYKNVKRGMRDDLGVFCRSAWEANWARYLNFLVANNGDPLERWEYEPDRFWFEPIRHGTTSYLPDFKLFEHGKEPYYQEVKGRMDQKSRTRLKRMAKYYPDVRVDLIDEKAYREVERKLSAAIPNWESSR